jgi:hypothetical protein
LARANSSTNLQNAIVSGTFVFVPLAIGFAVLKYRLYDIDLVINKTVVYTLLAAFITAVYVAIVVGIGALVGRGTSKESLPLSILATAVVAVAFQPVRDRVQRLANRLVYGKRATPYEVLSEFSSRMAGTYAGEDLLPRMARILAEGTGAREATVWLRVGEWLRPEGSWPFDDAPSEPLHLNGDGALPEMDATLALPVDHGGELLGALALTKAPGERLTPAEEHLASDLASGAGLVLRNARLTEETVIEWTRSSSLEPDRGGVGLGTTAPGAQHPRRGQQQLVALAVKVRLARSLTREGPEQGRGPIGADRARGGPGAGGPSGPGSGDLPAAAGRPGPGGRPAVPGAPGSLPVTVEAEGIGRYPQDHEAAVYFCVLEATQNVSKYAAASKATVRLTETDNVLAFEVEDDGAGFDPATRGYGTGMQGMADRLSALGGELMVRSAPGAGTTVTGRVPVPVRELVP